MMAPRRPYDLAVAYRIYPKVAKPAASLPFGDDKYRLAEIALRSFKESLGSLRVKIWALLDGCPPEYEGLFRKYFDSPDLEILNLDSVGNFATFRRQIDILCGQEFSEFVYFAEDDYVYLPGQFHRMLDFLRENSDASFVSPYDHLDCYTLDLHRGPKWMRTAAGQHWRTAASTCLTFLTRKTSLQSYEGVFRSYSRGNFDCSLWLSLTKHRVFNLPAFVRYLADGSSYWKILAKAWGYGWKQILFGARARLWVPVPAIATHLDSKALSPNIDWIAQIQRHAFCVAKPDPDGSPVLVSPTAVPSRG
jgi:hypothetical protein